MKKLLLAATLLATLSVKSQTRKDTTISDSIPIISIGDLKQALQYLSTKSTHADYLIIQDAYQLAINLANARMSAVKPKQPKK